MSSKIKTVKRLSAIIIVLTMIVGMFSFAAAESTTEPVTTAASSEFTVDMVFNVDYTSNPDENPSAGNFDPSKYLTIKLDLSKGFKDYSFTVAELKTLLGADVSKITSFGFIPDGVVFDENSWTFTAGEWPDDINKLSVANISIGSEKILTSDTQKSFVFKQFSEVYDQDWNQINPQYYYATFYGVNGVLSSNEGPSNSPCIKYDVDGTAGASWVVLKDAIDISKMADTDKLSLSMDLGSIEYTHWIPAPVAAAPITPAATYEIGPGKAYENIGDLAWESLKPGDTVYVNWRATPYNEKFSINVAGTAAKPIIVHGVPGPDGQLPVINGDKATTRKTMTFPSQSRGLIEIGSSSVSADYVTIENLEIVNAGKPFTYLDKLTNVEKAYARNASGIWLLRGDNVTIRNCKIHDCANGIFGAPSANINYYSGLDPVDSFESYYSKDILIEGNYLYNNGAVEKTPKDSQYEHNSYLAFVNTTYQFNHYGPLKVNSKGYCLKDRGAGTVVRYNWIEGGRRTISLDDAEDSPYIVFDPSYSESYIYGNVLIKPDGGFQIPGEDEVVSFGGDKEIIPDRRILNFYNNTIVSYTTKETYSKNITVSWATQDREPRTNIFTSPGRDQTFNVTNNIFYMAGNAIPAVSTDWGISGSVYNLNNNWFSKGWVFTIDGLGTQNEVKNNYSGMNPGFVNLYNKDFRLTKNSVCLDNGAAVEVTPVFTYAKDSKGVVRNNTTGLSIGAYEYGPSMIRRIK